MLKASKNIKEMVKVLRSRKCLYCGEPIKIYILSSLLIPPELTGIGAMKFSKEVNTPFPIYFFGENSYLFMERIILSSTCQCGNITFWNFDSDIFDALTSDELYKDGYGFLIIYGKEQIQEMYNNAPAGIKKDNLKKLLDSFPMSK